MKYIKITLASIFATAALLASVISARADTTCQVIYGGGQSCVSSNITINKMVQNPTDGTFADNFPITSSVRFNPGQTITYTITVTNSGFVNEHHVDVKDVFPSDIDFVKVVNGTGSYDANSRTLSYGFDNLGPNQSNIETIQAQVAPTNRLTGQPSPICNGNTTNSATATVSDQPVQQDTALICVNNQVLGTQTPGVTVFPAPSITSTPPTGPEVFGLIGLITSAFSGVILRKRASK